MNRERTAAARFPQIRFQGQLRPSQEDVVAIAERKLAEGKHRLHIVAPPGSGKTVLGLYLWAECVRRPALVLSPNSAIQSQWAARTDLFEISGKSKGDLVSTDPNRPALLTSLTYQSVTLPQRGGGDLDQAALSLWQDKLIEAEQAQDPDESMVWIQDLKRHNPGYYEQRLSVYRKQVRDRQAISGDALKTLHHSALATLHRVRQQGIGLIILDECHHLLGHWGRVLADAHEMLDAPIVIGLTATPPDRDGKAEEDVRRYDEFFGTIDYEVPVPAVVKDGFLAPYQDLAYFVRPSTDELKYIASADQQLHAIVSELCQEPEAADDANEQDATDEISHRRDDLGTVVVRRRKRTRRRSKDATSPASTHRSAAVMRDLISSHVSDIEPLHFWLWKVLDERRLATGVMRDWKAFERRDPEFANAARTFLLRRDIELPEEVPPPEGGVEPGEVTEMPTLVPVLDRYVRHRLRRSRRAADHDLAERVVKRLRTLGVQITETGSQMCASPVGRVMAYSRSKTSALVPILQAESEILGERLRAVVVADYEKTSAVTAEVGHLLDNEAGGAVAAFKALLSDPVTDALDPVLVTGSSVLVDEDAADRFDEVAGQWLKDNGFSVELSFGEEEGFHTISGRGSDWCPRVYVALITELFQAGLTRCLVGTRGLLGEGWDANKINVLIDLTSVTTSMTVNQLRGRSIRLDPGDETKLANNWDVVCIAPEFSKGLDDYYRFIAKHKTLFGVTDDGAIEKGVGHVHAAFTELKPEGVERSTRLLNADMLERVQRRDHVRSLWKIGEPYHNEPIRAVEARPKMDEGHFPPFPKSKRPWNASSLALAISECVLGSLHEARLISIKPPIHVGLRAGGYVRVFLEEAEPDDHGTFTTALREALGPLHRPRYVIPRKVDRVTDTLLSKFLPSVIGRFFQKRTRRRVMLHAVPNAMAKNKDLVTIYQRHWNRHVSPGEAVYAHRGTGEDLLIEARKRRQVPTHEVHQKEIFL